MPTRSSYSDTASVMTVRMVADLSGYLTEEEKADSWRAFWRGDLNGNAAQSVPGGQVHRDAADQLTDFQTFADATGTSLDEIHH
ncbi:MAG: hypothetical protein ACLSVD_04915 [Eggerthellaceae bacterium]